MADTGMEQAKDTGQKDYRVIAKGGFRLDRKYAEGDTLSLNGDQARYLLLNRKVELADNTKDNKAIAAPQDSHNP